LDAGEMSPRTYEAYELALRRHVLPVFGSHQVRGITADQLVVWIRDLRRAGYAPHSVHNYWAPINLVMRFAVRRGALASNPADQLTSAERPKPGLGRQRFLDRHEMERLLNAASDRYRVAIACGLFAGPRLSELLGLVWDDIDFRGETIRVRFQMGREGKRRPLKTAAARRDVILMKPLASELLRLRLASPFSGLEDLVFCSTAGSTIGHRNLTARGLEKAATRSRVDGATFHVLRHTFASMLILRGHDPVFVSHQLGHANAAITLKVYAHLFDGARHAREHATASSSSNGGLLHQERP